MRRSRQEIFDLKKVQVYPEQNSKPVRVNTELPRGKYGDLKRDYTDFLLI